MTLATDPEGQLYYKAIRPDGTDFKTGTYPYGRALETGEIVRHPLGDEMAADRQWAFIWMSTEPGNCTGQGCMKWPWRIVRVEPIGPVIVPDSREMETSRGTAAIRVVEELPSWMALGPKGQDVARIHNTFTQLGEAKRRRLASQKRHPDFEEAAHRTYNAAEANHRKASLYAAYEYPDRIDNSNAGLYCGDLAAALIARDHIDAETFKAMARPWVAAGLPRVWER